MTAPIKRLDQRDLPEVMLIEEQAHFYPWSLQVFQQCLNSQCHFGWGCFDNTQLVGFIWLSVIAPEAELLNMAIVPTHQRKGYAKILLNATLKQLQLIGVTQVFLEVRASNDPAIHCYQSVGFIESGLRKNYYRTIDPHVHEDALLMRLNLS